MISLPPDHRLEVRSVKHARLRVTEDQQVLVIVPPNFSDEEISALMLKKERWIAEKQRFFSKKKAINLQRNQILLKGVRHNFFYDSAYQRKVQICHEHKTVRAKRDLLDQATQERWLKKLAKEHLSARTRELSANLKLAFNNLFIRSQKNKWGNCSRDKNISLNWRLIKAPEYVIDYIIVHELVHTIRMDHSIKFWTLLRSYYPDYKRAVKWLDIYGNNL